MKDMFVYQSCVFKLVRTESSNLKHNIALPIIGLLFNKLCMDPFFCYLTSIESYILFNYEIMCVIWKFLTFLFINFTYTFVTQIK